MQQLVRRIREFFDPSDGQEEGGLDLDLAAATLLLEIAWTDHHVDPREAQVARHQLRRLFVDADEAELDLLVERARERVKEATGLYPFTAAVNARASLEEKRRLLTALWRVALADGSVSPLEEHTIRRVADLLHLTHREFIAAKLAARDRRSS